MENACPECGSRKYVEKSGSYAVCNHCVVRFPISWYSLAEVASRQLDEEFSRQYQAEWRLIRSVIFDEHKPVRLEALLRGTNTKFVLGKLLDHPLVRDADMSNTPMPLSTRRWLINTLKPPPSYREAVAELPYATVTTQQPQKKTSCYCGWVPAYLLSCFWQSNCILLLTDPLR